jgi:hypothetical protein
MSEAFSDSAICQSAFLPEDLPQFIYLLYFESPLSHGKIHSKERLQNSHMGIPVD